MSRKLDYFVVLEDRLTDLHVPYNLRIFVNDVLRVKELNQIDLCHQPITRPIKNSSARPQRIRIDVCTPCGLINREFIFDPAFCGLR